MASTYLISNPVHWIFELGCPWINLSSGPRQKESKVGQKTLHENILKTFFRKNIFALNIFFIKIFYVAVIFSELFSSQPAVVMLMAQTSSCLLYHITKVTHS